MQPGTATQLAMEAELAAVESYLNLALEVRQLGAKDMFVHLAKDEMTHFRMLRNLAASQKAPRVMDVPTWDRLMENIGNLGTTKVPGKQQADAVKLALAEEEKAEQNYRQEAEQAEDEATRSTWLGLAAMERGHAEILRAQLRELDRSGFWLDFFPVIQARGSEQILPPLG